MLNRPFTAVLISLVLLTVLTSCEEINKLFSLPLDENTTQTTTPPRNSFYITTSAVDARGHLLTKHGAYNGRANISPPLEWGNVPEGTTSFAIELNDEDFPMIHWTLVALNPTLTSLSEGTLAGGEEKTEYTGPFPPPGSVHDYKFTIYAVNESPLRMRNIFTNLSGMQDFETAFAASFPAGQILGKSSTIVKFSGDA
ncbi:MAG: YbhB/YbcL family Raf kinase inhibitor-like protein [Spirochaetales bacterium]|nr:YbhB/YbcL family Raf kinase inhibitor-like protein [Spirochaetales bacterium]